MSLIAENNTSYLIVHIVFTTHIPVNASLCNVTYTTIVLISCSSLLSNTGYIYRHRCVQVSGKPVLST